ncbi:hypothetical protein MUO56_01970 [Candidatus Bathyarchaeota archaeon]|nr:hypothetical protein [Candidatus Bathyarchaeota archaeon]
MAIKLTMKNLLLIIGAVFFLLGSGYNVYQWNTSGKTDVNLQLVGLFLVLIALAVKKKDIEG